MIPLLHSAGERPNRPGDRLTTTPFLPGLQGLGPDQAIVCSSNIVGEHDGKGSGQLPTKTMILIKLTVAM